MTCFTRQGFTNTTMDDIAAESGLSKGSLYWYFDGKDDLLMSAITSGFEDMALDALAKLQTEETPAGMLRSGAWELAHFAGEAEGLFNLFVEFWAQSSQREEAARVWTDMLSQYHGIIVSMIEEGVRREDFRPVDAGALVWAIMAAYDGLAAYAMMTSDVDVHHVSEVFIETLLQGLEVPETPAQEK